jgi:hypothetical protein
MIRKWLDSLLKPTAIQGIDLASFKKAIQSDEVQTVWLASMVQKLQDANIAVDGFLDKADKDRLWETVIIERRTILRCLNMILEAQQRLENERFEQSEQDRRFTMYQGASAPLDNRR